MREVVSDTAEFGDYTSGPRIIDENVRASMQDVLGDIQSGAWAKRWIDDMGAGEADLARLRAAAKGSSIETVGKELRELMHREGA